VVAAEDESSRCPGCESSEFSPTGLRVDAAGTPADLIRCRRCRTERWQRAHTEEDADVSVYWELYKADVDLDPDVRMAFERRYAAVFERLERVAEPLRILDIGGGIGNFAAWAERDLGAATVTADVDETAIARARARGLTAMLAGDVPASIEPASMNVVSLWDVIEHVADPTPLLTQAAAALAPGGRLVLETPDARFPLRPVLLTLHRISGGRLDLTGPLYYWEHKTYYTEKGMRELLGRHGFRITWCERWTSPSAKLTRTLDEVGREGTRSSRVVNRGLSRAYPMIDRIISRVGAGNKLMIIATRDGDAAET